MAVTAGLIEKCIAENARVALDQIEYQKRYNRLSEWFEKTKAQLAEVEEQLKQTKSRKQIFDNFIGQLAAQDGILTDFDEGLWCGLLNFATVHDNGEITFTFKNGLEMVVE